VLEVGVGKFRAWNQNCCFSSTFVGEQGSCLHAFGHLGLLCVFKVLFNDFGHFAIFAIIFGDFDIFIVFFILLNDST
jgi:hypothetical protein